MTVLSIFTAVLHLEVAAMGKARREYILETYKYSIR